jgi:hypothetical protein
MPPRNKALGSTDAVSLYEKSEFAALLLCLVIL